MEAAQIEGHHLWREFLGAVSDQFSWAVSLSQRMILFQNLLRTVPSNSMRLHKRPFLGRYGRSRVTPMGYSCSMPNNTCEHCGGSQLISGLIVSASGGGGDVRPGLLCKAKEKGFFKMVRKGETGDPFC